MLKRLIGASAVLGLAAAAALAGDSVVVPQQFLNQNTANGLNSTTRNAPNARTYQCAFAASELSGIAPGSQITGLTWRCWQGQAQWPGVDANWTDYDVYVSTSRNAPGSLSTVFADNEGADRVLVRSGALTIPAGSFPAGSNPPADRFGHVITFSTPFTYNGGDLCVTVRHTGNDTGTAAFVDNATEYGSGVHGGYNTAYDSTTMAFTYTGPLVTKLFYSGGARYTCSITGTCPGQVTLSWSGAQPNRQQGILFASNTGNFTITTGQCAGTQTGLGTQNLRLYNVISTGSGSGSVNAQAGPGACRGFVQLIQVPGCQTSNVAQVP